MKTSNPAGLRRCSSVFTALLWRQWRLSGVGFLTNILIAIWGTWAVQFFVTPWTVMVYLMPVAAAIGSVAGQSGNQEFTLALPPPRKYHFLAALVLSLGALTVMLGIETLGMALNLPQLVWGMVVDSGFTEPFPPAPLRDWLLMWSLPLSVFAVSFALAARAQKLGAVVLGGIVSLIAISGLAYLGHSFEPNQGALAVLFPLVVGITALILGYRYYLSRDVSAPVDSGS